MTIEIYRVNISILEALMSSLVFVKLINKNLLR